MSKAVGTMAIGVRAPIIRENDNLPQIVAESVANASKELKIPVEHGDIICVTESVVARSEGNYVSVDDIALDVASKFGTSKVAVVHPILSRNRFAMCFKGICRGARGGVILVLSLPCDEVGNHLISEDDYYNSGLAEKTIVSEKEFRKQFHKITHEFTGVDYVEYYKSIARQENCEIEVYFTNDLTGIVHLSRNILTCDIHTRFRSKSIFHHAGALKVYGLDEICSSPNRETGYNPKYGLLGSNKANEELLKLMPRNAEYVVSTVQYLLYMKYNISVDVLVYGDGAFKDPVGKIWELADPVVGVAYSKSLSGRPNELKLKALADGKFANLDGKELEEAIKQEIKAKEKNLTGRMESQGTTPRQISDLLGSLADLVSGSGDKGTPIVWIKGYFKNYSD